MKPVVPKPQRCAIYTRKSTEHNLDRIRIRAGSLLARPVVEAVPVAPRPDLKITALGNFFDAA
jgi:hypothetical protein